jgi:hypothetical protein
LLRNEILGVSWSDIRYGLDGQQLRSLRGFQQNLKIESQNRANIDANLEVSSTASASARRSGFPRTAGCEGGLEETDPGAIDPSHPEEFNPASKHVFSRNLAGTRQSCIRKLQKYDSSSDQEASLKVKNKIHDCKLYENGNIASYSYSFHFGSETFSYPGFGGIQQGSCG